MIRSEIFVSYAWEGESEKIVNELDASLQKKGLTIVRDKRDLNFKELITDFMKAMGRGKAVIIVLSDNYLKSPYCMFELLEIYKNRDFLSRIFPIVLEDALIFDPISRLNYFAYWKTKKTELEEAINKFGADAITVIGDEYKIYHKIFSNFGEIANVLKDINSLTPTIHRESDFNQLFEGLLKLDDDFISFNRGQVSRVGNELFLGSKKYYKELTSANGPYHKLNISESILASLRENDALNTNQLSKLSPMVNDSEGLQIPIGDYLHRLWSQEKRHLILLGEGGMGKTVTLIHLWETLLKKRQDDETVPIPLFLTLNHYNSLDESARSNFIIKQILWHYLGIKERPGELVDDLWYIFKQQPSGGLPKVVILLDGFNEITVDAAQKRLLLLEMQDLRQKGNCIQMVLSSRYEMNFTWAEGFQISSLQPLNDTSVAEYLQFFNVSIPKDRALLSILKNPMMLTLYANANEIVEKYEDNLFFDFIPQASTHGEVFWNFFESQIVKLNKNYGVEDSQFYYYKFMIRHFLPYIGYEMERSGQFAFEENELLRIISEGCRHFYRRDFIMTNPEYKSHIGTFNLEANNFVDEASRFESIANVLCNFLCMMKKQKSVYEFLHQNFRDYFAAMHILSEMKASYDRKEVPAVLVERPLPIFIRKFIGNLSGEHRHSKATGDYSLLVMKIMAELRGQFNRNLTGYSVWNIVNVLREACDHFSNFDFSSLNLAGVGFQQIPCSHRINNTYTSARFDQCLIDEGCFFPKFHTGPIQSIVFNHSGNIFISASSDTTIKVWDYNTDGCIATLKGHTKPVRTVLIHPDEKKIVSGSEDKLIKVWNFETGESIADFVGHNNTVTSLALQPTGKILISTSLDRAIKFWDLETGNCFHTITGYSTLLCVAANPKGGTFITGSRDGFIKLWDFEAKKLIQIFRGHLNAISSLAFDKEGKYFLSGSWDNTVKIWNINSGKCEGTFYGHKAFVTNLDFHPDGKTFITASGDKTCKAWDIATRECLATFNGHSKELTGSVAFHPDGKTFLSASEDNTLLFWNLKTCESIATVTAYPTNVNCIAVHPGGKIFISAGEDKTVKVWNSKTGRCLAILGDYSNSVNTLAFHPDGKSIITGSIDGTIKYENLLTGESITLLNATFQQESKSGFSAKWPEAEIKKIWFHSSGSLFFSLHKDGEIKMWNIKTKDCFTNNKFIAGKVQLRKDIFFFLRGNEVSAWKVDMLSRSKNWLSNIKTLSSGRASAHIQSFAVHPIEEYMVIVYDNGIIESWDINTKDRLRIGQFLSSKAVCIEFSSDGAFFVTGHQDGSFICWDTTTKSHTSPIKAHDSEILSITFYPDVQYILTIGKRDSVVKTWDIQNRKCIYEITNYHGMELAGCSLTNLHSDSKLTAKDNETIRQYGVIFNEEDRKVWKQSINVWLNL